MRVYFTTVIRYASHQKGGELVCLDWQSKCILARRPMMPTDPDLPDVNPRGGTRGGRGILRRDDLLYVATYHSLHIFDQDLTERGRISNYLLVGLHELCEVGSLIWVASTAIDAAVAVDTHGTIQAIWWSRECKRLQERLGLDSLTIDKTVDNRLLWLDQKHTKSKSHTHLNALCEHRGDLYVLLNRFGVVYNITKNRVLIEDPTIIGAHNLAFVADRCVINDTRGKKVKVYDERGVCERTIDLQDYAEIRRIDEAATDADHAARPLFVRGLHVFDDGRMLVGFSPAAIAEIDLNTGELRDLYQYSTRVRECVHGLLAWP